MSSAFQFVQIPPEDLSGLVSILENRLPKAAQLCNIVKIRLQTDFPEVTTFFRYNGLPDQLTCFLSQISTPTKVFWCILAPICSDVERAEVMGSFTPMVDWTRRVSFNGVDELIFDHFSEFCSNPAEFPPMVEQRMALYAMPRNVAINLNLSLPPGIIVRKLEPKDIETVFTYWEYANDDPNKLELVKGAATHVASAGLFLDGHLISWGVGFRDGGIHAVFTLEPYRGHDYGKIVMRHLCRWVAEELNHIPVVHIKRSNIASFNLMTGIGFQRSHGIVWLEFGPRVTLGQLQDPNH